MQYFLLDIHLVAAIEAPEKYNLATGFKDVFQEINELIATPELIIVEAIILCRKCKHALRKIATAKDMNKLEINPDNVNPSHSILALLHCYTIVYILVSFIAAAKNSRDRYMSGDQA